MSTMEQQAETELVSGVITSIIDKGNGKWQVAVRTDPTSQYTRNLWSDDAGLVSQLAMMINSTQSFLCRISHWTRNDGSPVRSLWIQGVGPQAQQPVQQPLVNAGQVIPQVPVPAIIPQSAAHAQAQAQPQVRISEGEREARIHRQTASKVAAILLARLPEEQQTFDTLIVIAERLCSYYTHGMESRQLAEGGFDGDPGPMGIPHGDDDVPFLPTDYSSEV